MQLFAFLNYIWCLIFGFPREQIIDDEEEMDEEDIVYDDNGIAYGNIDDEIKQFTDLFGYGFRFSKNEDGITAIKNDEYDDEQIQIEFYKVDDWFIAKIDCKCKCCRIGRTIDSFHYVYFRKEKSEAFYKKEENSPYVTIHPSHYTYCMTIIATTVHNYKDGNSRVSNYFHYSFVYYDLDDYEYEIRENEPVILHESYGDGPEYNLIKAYDLGQKEIANNNDFIEAIKESNKGLHLTLERLNGGYKGVKSARK